MKTGHEIIEEALAKAVKHDWNNSPAGMSPEEGRAYQHGLAAAYLHALEMIPASPIDMVMHCPKCGLQHIDRPDPHTKTCLTPGGEGDDICICPEGHWTNPPHKSHLCRKEDGGCGHVWRPSSTHYTNGVQAVEPGKNDSPLVPPLGPLGVDLRLGKRRYVAHSNHFRNGTMVLTIKVSQP
jgi:hypothetical protein